MKAIINIIRWTVGIILCLASIAGFAGGDIALASFIALIGLCLLPPVAAMISNKLKKPGTSSQLQVQTIAPVITVQQPTYFHPQTLSAAVAPQQLPVKSQEQNIVKPAKKSGGLVNWFKGWRTSITAATALESCIKSFPDVNPAKLNTLLSTKEKWSEKETEFIRLRIIDKYDKHITADNVETLGHKYLEFYKTIFPAYPGTEILQKINAHKVEAFLFTRVNDDEALDPVEIDEIIKYSSSLNVPDFDSKDKIRKEYDYYITNWELDKGLFQGLSPDFMMNKNEICIYKLENCEMLERKSVTVKRNYGGMSYRVKIAKGISYRTGSYNVSSEKELMEVSKGKGVLNVTTKRILFKGKEGIITINTNAIVDMEPFQDAVVIHKASGKPLSIKTPEGIRLYKYLRSATRR